jgi:UDP-N-acetylglucosamine 2-epimerase (non-hydrolysing)
MLDQVHAVFGIRPDHDLAVFAPGQSLTDITTRTLAGYSHLFADVHAAAVVVQGDTATTLAAALAAFYHHVPVVHVEAGLRTDDPAAPFPEEINRRLTSQLARLHLAPTAGNRANLLRDGVAAAAIRVTGNTVVDALLEAVALPGGYDDPALEDLDEDRRRVVLVTAHRRESWGDGHESIARAVAEIARTEPDVLVVFPIHRNPVVREAILPWLADLDNVRVTEPLGYRGLVKLMQRSDLILTDSGGIQEEGPSLGKPVLVMRDTTERPEAVTAGTVRLVGTDELQIVGAVRTVLHDPAEYAAMANAVNPYGDGRAAQRSVDAVEHLLGLGEKPAEFAPELEAV